MNARLTSLARALQGNEGPLGLAMVLVAFGLVAMMLIRVAIAFGPGLWHAL